MWEPYDEHHIPQIVCLTDIHNETFIVEEHRIRRYICRRDQNMKYISKDQNRSMSIGDLRSIDNDNEPYEQTENQGASEEDVRVSSEEAKVSKPSSNNSKKVNKSAKSIKNTSSARSGSPKLTGARLKESVNRLSQPKQRTTQNLYPEYNSNESKVQAAGKSSRLSVQFRTKAKSTGDSVDKRPVNVTPTKRNI